MVGNSKREWRFIRGRDAHWRWELHNGTNTLIARSLGRFQSKEHCVADAAEHGYSRFFSRRREVDETTPAG